jgi:hypothetical protein
MSYYVGSDLISTADVTFGTVLPNPQILPSYSDNSLELEEVYKFLG